MFKGSYLQHDSLQQLVQSLDQGEQRYVKIWLKRWTAGRANNFSRMFSAILENKAEEAGEIRSINVVRHQLFGKILEALAEFKRESDLATEIRRSIQHAGILMDKKLFNSATEIVEKAIVLAEENGQMNQLLELYELQLRLYHSTTNTKGLSTLLQNTEDKRSKILNHFKWNWELQDISYQLFIMLKTEWVGGERSALGLLKRLEHIDPEKLPAASLRISYHQALSGVYFSRNETEAAHACLLKIRLEFLSSPELITRYFNQYVASMNNLNLLLAEKGDYEAVNENVKSMRLVRAETAEQKIRILERVVNAELAILRARKKFNEGEELLNEAAYLLKNKKLSLVYKLLFRFDICVFRLLQKNYSEALLWLSEIRKEKEQEIRPDIKACCFILEMILFSEMNNLDKLEKVVRRLQKRERIHQVDEMLRSFTAHFARIPGTSMEEKKYRSEFLEKLEHMEKDPQLQKTYFGNFPFKEWFLGL